MSYCTADDLRAEGISEEQYDDEQLERLISISCNYIDNVTGQWFELREKVIKLDGRGGENLILPVFLFEADSVQVNGCVIDDYVLYNRMEDRGYPKIYRAKRWDKGRLNIEVSGKWGYVEEDGTTPAAIRRAAMKLALYNFPALGDSEAQEEKNLRGKILSETTDGHSYSLSESAVTGQSSSSLTGDTEIDQILSSYMRKGFGMSIV